MKRVAIVTGAGQGIGAGIAKQLAADGLTVAVADLKEDNAKKVAAEIGQGAQGYFVDVAQKQSVFDLVAAVVKDFEHLDVMVNNAGIAKIGPLIDAEEKDISQILDINVKGDIYGIQAAAKQFQKQKLGAKLLMLVPLLAIKDLKCWVFILLQNLRYVV